MTTVTMVLARPVANPGLLSYTTSSFRTQPGLVSTLRGPYQLLRAREALIPRSTSSAASVPSPEEPGGLQEPLVTDVSGQAQQQQAKGLVAWFQSLRQQNREGKNRLAALGLAAVLAYGLFDGISYTTAFSIAFLGYEARTGLNPTQNVADLVKICVLMWAGNNVTRPFRIAGAAGLAPFMDRLMDRLQARLGLPQKFYAFLLITLAVAATCLSIVGTLFVSRLVRG